MELIKQIAQSLGWWVTQVGEEWLLNPAGLHMAVSRFVVGDKPGVYSIVDEADAEGNLRSIKEARKQADWVLVHLHSHEWDPERGYDVPAKFVPPFARACIDAGADIFVAQGSHAQLRGIEVYRDRPIFYDPGDFIAMSTTVTKLPADFYLRAGYPSAVRGWDATPSDAFDARAALPKPLSPPGGLRSGKVVGSVLGLCTFGPERRLSELKLYPLTLVREPRSRSGIPLLADSDMSRKLIEYLAELSSPFGTRVEFKDGVGLARL